jgi:nitrogen fixation protein NifB
VISPEEAVSVVREATRLSENIAVAGIAGPGDPLASRHALETFALIKKEFPRLIKCMSTNGLLLPRYAEEIIEVCVSSLTVTVNDIYPETLVKINDKIVYGGELISGERSAKVLIENQLEGIKTLSRHGVVIKVNTVLVPGVNDDHIAEIARRVKEAGASIYNIIPLIPQNEFAGESPPSCDAINCARAEAEKHIDVFRHCQHCRADAIGIPGGKDYAQKIYGKGFAAKERFSHG